DHGGASTLYEQAEARAAAAREAVLADPLVRQLMAAFPGSTLVDVDEARDDPARDPGDDARDPGYDLAEDPPEHRRSSSDG
ncbi:MAG: hypothetical protein ACRYG4_05075, partial [Janthinobacterium lividum]